MLIIYFSRKFELNFLIFLFFLSKKNNLYCIYHAYVKTSLKIILVDFLSSFLLCTKDEQVDNYISSSSPNQSITSRAWQNNVFCGFNKEKPSIYKKNPK